TVSLPPDIYTLSLHDALPICSPSLKIAPNGSWRMAGIRSQLMTGMTWRPLTTPSAPRARKRHVPHSSWCGPILVMVHRINRTPRSEEHTSELQSRGHLVCRLL